jgi:hypothetical protein
MLLTETAKGFYAGGNQRGICIGSNSAVSTVIERTKNEIIKNRKLRRHIEQLRHELEMSQETPPIELRVS